MADPFFQVEKTCPVCEQNFKLTKTRGQGTVISTDTDFCTHFRDLNPYYYAVWVCPHCGFAAHEDRFFTLGDGALKKMKEFLAGRKVNLDLSGVRTWDQAVTSYKLAIFYAGMTGLPASHIASLELRLAWLYREKQMTAEETDVLRQAVQNYENAYMHEQTPIGNMTEVVLTYIIGELLRRVGRYGDAAVYLSRVISNPEARSEKRILALARDSWEAVREAKKASAPKIRNAGDKA